MLDGIWQKYARQAGILAARPDFRHDPLQDGAVNFYRAIRHEVADVDATLTALTTDPELKAALAEGVPEAAELVCELIRLGAPVDAEVSDFSCRAYLQRHPDVVAASLDALYHYLRYGVHEAPRKTLAHVRKGQLAGRVPFRADRPTCLIAVHEMSRTGAPIVGRDLMREASATHNVVVVSLRAGELLDQFLDGACAVAITEDPAADFPYLRGPAFRKIDFAILNSVECARFVAPLVAADVPFCAYLHEYAQYSFPVWTSTLLGLFSDLVVYSSEHVRASWAGRLADIEFDAARDTVLIPQRPEVFGAVPADAYRAARSRLSEVLGTDLTGRRLICGAGHVSWRKGTDIFVMASQIAAVRDPAAVFLWIGDGQNPQDLGFGVWFDYQLREVGAGTAGSNLFVLPAGPLYHDVLKAADAMFLSSRLDPLPNVVFDALERGCPVVGFENGSGFCDDTYRAGGHFTAVEYGNPGAAVEALLALPVKRPGGTMPEVESLAPVFERIRDALKTRLLAQSHFVSGATAIDIPILFTADEADRPFRVREREKILRYGRRLLWRDVDEARRVLAASTNWVPRSCRIADYAQSLALTAPPFGLHIHAHYTDELGADLESHAAIRLARRLVITTDTAAKAEEIGAIVDRAGLSAEVRIVPNRGRDILPFIDLFGPEGIAPKEDIWGHLHQKKSLTSTKGGDVWKRFLHRILLGDQGHLSSALAEIARPQTGLVAPLDPHFVPWNASRAIMARVADRLPGPLPDNPLVFPVGNMFWVRRPVVEAMAALFGPDYPWPNEPIADDGTELHLMERLWPAVAASCGLASVFVWKPDEARV